MVKKISIYEKDFIGRIETPEDPHSGYKKSKEDEKIRNELESKYGEIITYGGLIKKDKYLGADSQVTYIFYIEEKDVLKKNSNQVEYKTLITLIKNGNEKILDKPCDLEELLINHGFKNLKDKKFLLHL